MVCQFTNAEYIIVYSWFRQTASCDFARSYNSARPIRLLSEQMAPSTPGDQ